MASFFNAILVGMGLATNWPTYTMADVRLHNCDESMWIVAGASIYDVTHFVYDHPGGPAAIVKRAGGCRDCTQDLQFHSKAARAEWRQYKIGVVGTVTTGKLLPPANRQSVDGGEIVG